MVEVHGPLRCLPVRVLFYSTVHTTILALTSVTARPHPNVSSFRHGILVYSHVKPQFLYHQVMHVTYFLKLKIHIKPSLRYKGGSIPWSVNTG